MAEAVEQMPVEAHTHAPRQRSAGRGLGVVQDAIGDTAKGLGQREIGAGAHRDRRPDLQAAACLDRGGAGRGRIVQLQHFELSGCDRLIDQRIVGVHHHADARDMARHARGQLRRTIAREVARGGREEHEADMARPAGNRRVERLGRR